MTIGAFTRKLLGENFQVVGRIYRSIFVDLNAVANSISAYIPQGAMIIDVGGGSGHLLNHLLSLREDLEVKMLDLSPTLGDAISECHLPKVDMYPETSMAEFSCDNNGKALVVLISDVIHHVPVEARATFFSGLNALLQNNNGASIIIKDVEPGHIRSLLGFLADRYVSGDKNVSLIDRDEVTKKMFEPFGDSITTHETNLFNIDKPNFALVFTKD